MPGIIAERARRIHEIKEAEKRERIRKQKAKDDAIEVALIVMGVSVGVMIIMLFFLGLHKSLMFGIVYVRAMEMTQKN